MKRHSIEYEKAPVYFGGMVGDGAVAKCTGCGWISEANTSLDALEKMAREHFETSELSIVPNEYGLGVARGLFLGRNPWFNESGEHGYGIPEEIFLENGYSIYDVIGKLDCYRADAIKLIYQSADANKNSSKYLKAAINLLEMAH